MGDSLIASHFLCRVLLRMDGGGPVAARVQKHVVVAYFILKTHPTTTIVFSAPPVKTETE